MAMASAIYKRCIGVKEEDKFQSFLNGFGDLVNKNWS